MVKVLESNDEADIAVFKREVRENCMAHPIYMTKTELSMRANKLQS